MKRNTAETDELFDELVDHLYSAHPARARHTAERLAAALGEPTAESVLRHIHSWILIHEARGNLEESVRLQDLEIARKRSEIESGDYDAHPNLLPGEVEYLQDSLYFQAERLEKIDKRHDAINCLNEVLDLAKRYGIEADEDTLTLYAELTSKPPRKPGPAPK